MAELLRTRCTAGWLIITDQAVRIERKGFLGAGAKMQVLPRAQLVSVNLENKMAPVMGQGGATTLTFTGYGAMLVAKMVVLKDARKVMELLGFA